MISIYTGAEQVTIVPSPNCCCTYCTEQAFEIVNGIQLCGIPGNHPDLELSAKETTG